MPIPGTSAIAEPPNKLSQRQPDIKLQAIPELILTKLMTDDGYVSCDVHEDDQNIPPQAMSDGDDNPCKVQKAYYEFHVK